MTPARDTEARIRAGWRPSIAEKIRNTPTLEELEGLLGGLKARGYPLTTDDMEALQDAARLFEVEIR